MSENELARHSDANEDPSHRAPEPFWASLLSPLDAIRNVHLGARRMLDAPVGAFVAALFTQALFLGLTLASLGLAAILLEPLNQEITTFGVARARLNGGALIGAFEALVGLGFVVALALPLVFAVFYAGRTARDQSILRAIQRNYRAASATLLTTTIATGLGGWAFFGADYFERIALLSGSYDRPWPYFPLIAIACAIGGVLLIRNAIIATCVAADLPAPKLSLRCEGCGYDLSHVAESGACTECNEPAARSLTPGIRRPGAAWQREPGRFGAWLSTSMTVLFSPRRFYSEYQFRKEPDVFDRFSTMHYRYIALIAPLWMSVSILLDQGVRLFSLELGLRALVSAGFVITLVIALAQGTSLGRFRRWRPINFGFFLLPFLLLVAASSGRVDWLQYVTRDEIWAPWIFAIIASLVCWVGHRAGAAIVMAFAMGSRMLPDWRWAEKIVAYESVFLWVYCTGWGMLVSSYILFGTWLSDSIIGEALRILLLGFFPEVAALILFTLVMSILWVWRYWVALKAARWSNF